MYTTLGTVPPPSFPLLTVSEAKLGGAWVVSGGQLGGNGAGT